MMKAKVGMKGIEIEWPVEGVGQQDVVGSHRVSADFTKCETSST